MSASTWREPPPASKLVEVRCRDCGHLICKIDADRARVVTVCPDRRCKRYQVKELRRDAG